MRVFSVVDFCAITKLVTVFISSLRFFVVQRNGIHVERRQRVEFVRFRDAVVIGVLPESQRSKSSITAVYNFVAVSAILWLIKLGQSEEAISLFTRRRLRLRSEVT